MLGGGVVSRVFFGGVGAKRGKMTNLYGRSTFRIGNIVRLGGNIYERNRWMPLGTEEARSGAERGGGGGQGVALRCWWMLEDLRGGGGVGLLDVGGPPPRRCFETEGAMSYLGRDTSTFIVA